MPPSSPSSAQSFPLQWPTGWPRTGPEHATNEHRFARNVTVFSATGRLTRALTALKASNVVISTNMKLRQDGLPYSGQAQPKDAGVAVYFLFCGRDLAIARDVYGRVELNMTTLAHALEHLRGLERHGGAHMMERSFAGFAALPTPGTRVGAPWWETLRVGVTATGAEIMAARALLVRDYHPDTGRMPSVEKFQDVMEAARRGLAERAAS